jgi:2-oxoglutarate dehydrogenase E1 component
MDVPFDWNADYIDAQYQRWKSDPHQVSRDWQWFFSGFEWGAFPDSEALGICDREQVLRQARVAELIHRYRDLGHLLACLDPLSACPTGHPLLDLAAFELSEADLDRTFYTDIASLSGQATLGTILRALRETYCRSVGIEYMHLQDPGERRWLQERMEPTRNQPALDPETKIHMLGKLSEATLFEHFLHTKYIGQKRFSLEGAEACIGLLDAVAEQAASDGCREIVLGMAHRGRLNVQVHILGKAYEEIFCEFEDSYDPHSLAGAGDVKYHRGYLGRVRTRSGNEVRMLLSDNPSHLEAVDPVVEGLARARQDLLGQAPEHAVLPVLIHGDAAFSGQGVVAETLNLSQLEGYRTGGTIHIVINNQIGFTTLPQDARSTRYSTDIAKMLMVPIFHVHAEDPEALIQVARLAHQYRREFGKDVVIDAIGYRRYGHNEGDEPYYTQPLMYERIRERPPLHEIYAARLLAEKVVSDDQIQRLLSEITAKLERSFRAAKDKTCTLPPVSYFEEWTGISGEYRDEPVATGVDQETMVAFARRLHELPEGFAIHPKLQRILERRHETLVTGQGIDWSGAEMMALATLLAEGTPVRLSGEDTRRGTFSHRHSVLVDPHSERHYTPLAALASNQAPFYVYDSMLSEYAVLGFEYGYSLATPHGLTLWEAQFGDFANGAQVIIDQFIVSGETKWQRLSGLVLLLPHGFEGQGAEHSSARLERFLQLCADDNIQVAYPSTPAQYFHLLRRQVRRPFRKPLVVLAPKSLLRHPQAVSSLEDLAVGHFREVMDDPVPPPAPSRVLLCTGKIYYDLAAERSRRQREDVAIVRIEQLYPFPQQQLAGVLERYAGAGEWFWVQEEPENMGAWQFIQARFPGMIARPLAYVGRAAAASPATGFHQLHQREQAAVLEQALD